jgi:hypothetical protein
MQTPGTVGRGGSLAWHGGSGGSDRLAELTVAVEALAAQNLDGLADAVRAERVLVLRRLVDRLEGQWLNELAGVDARGAAGAELGQQVGSTAGWLRARLRLGARAAAGSVRTARALFGGPLTGTAQALIEGTISAVHASVVAHGTCDLLDHRCAEAEPILVEAACRLDPPRLRRVLGHLRLVADPDGEHDRTQQRRRGLWLAPTFEGMVAVGGLLEPEAGQLLLAVLEPLARPADTNDARSGSQRRADALAELARRALESGRLPQTGGVRPQLTVTVDLDSLLGRRHAVGGEAGAVGPLDPEACRRLACDGAVTRVLATRQPSSHRHSDPGHSIDQGPGGQAPSTDQGPVAPDPSRQERPMVRDPSRDGRPVGRDPSGVEGPVARDPGGVEGLGVRLWAAVALLPPALGGAPPQPLEVGRASRVVQSAQRTALAVRDGGCVFPGCARPLAWCEAHHLRHWLHGGPTDLANLALVCRAHHRAVHEGGWQLVRQADGRVTATPPHYRPPRRRQPSAA